MENCKLEEIAGAFENPSFYGHPVKKIERKETHISVVFLTGDRVYKIKKPVNFGFLNYETLELRKFYCHQEIKLNQRLSSGVYLHVASVCRKPDGTLKLNGCSSPIEYVVVMKQLPDTANFQYLLASGKCSDEDINKISIHLAQFYSKSSVFAPHQVVYGDAEFVRFNAYENVYQLMPFAEHIGGADLLGWLKLAAYKFTLRYRSLFSQRVSQGYIKNGHGDLRAEHIYLYDGVQVLDCIEFNDRLRYGDVAVDLAFLFMDLRRLNFSDVAYSILNGYCEYSGDYQLWCLLDFYTAYRSLVRAKVACLETLGLASGESQRREQLYHRARQFMQYGILHTMAYDIPAVIVFMGLPASGKSAHGRRVSSAFHIERLSSDIIRKEAFPDSGISSFGKGSYTSEHRNRVYEIMIKKCKNLVENGRSVVLDATFSKHSWRQMLLDELANCKCYTLFVETSASVDTLKTRLKRREDKPNVTSDARIEHLDSFLKSYEHPVEIPDNMIIKVNTEGNAISTTGKIMQHIYKKRLNMAEGFSADMLNNLKNH